MSEDLLPALRSAVISIPQVTTDAGSWRGEPAVFTRRPIPDDAAGVEILINPPAAVMDGGGLTPGRSVITHDIAVYGQKGAAGSSSDETRAVERVAFAVREHFHRNRFSVQPAGFHVIDVRAVGPFAAPVDDDTTVGRIVSVTVSLRRAG